MDRASVEQWMQGYLKAWASDEAEDIAALFAEDARYRPRPYQPAWEGREAIVSEWIARGDKDEEWAFAYEIAAVDGAVAVILGDTDYPDPDAQRYSNVWVIRFDADGRAVDFVEYWMRKPKPE